MKPCRVALVRPAVKIVIGIAAIITLGILIAPMPSFHAPLSTVVEASDGTLLGARVAADGQWRFPPPDSLPDKYVTCLINYEDRYFRWHPGVNPVAVAKALMDNISAGETVRGGSTITMQVARMSRGNPDRTYGGKIIEMLSAVKLELFSTKRTILHLYAANAPFGGNTVGIEAAAWRYTGRSTADLSWAEAATLAVLPNAPSLIYPGRNAQKLRDKRDRLLQMLVSRGVIDSLTCSLAVSEPLPGAPRPMPSLAPHLTDRMMAAAPGSRVRSTVDPLLQKEVTALVNSHQAVLEGNGIHNAAAMVVDVASGSVLAYAGNSTLPDSAGRHGREVDMIPAPRSTGSIVKPFLYAALLSSGEMLPNAIIPDIPTRFQGFRPENSDFSYSGAVPAGDALARSLNIPAVRMLQMLDEERFLILLRSMGLTTFDKPASHYGLSLILGGGEASLWELAGAYASMARVLRNSLEDTSSPDDWHMPVVIQSADRDGNRQYEASAAGRSSQSAYNAGPPLTPPAIWLTYEALRRVNRPETETGWQYFGSAPEVAWKTGTSFGYRDAWAIGTTPDFVVAVWTGNADGEGRPGLSGISSSAPLLFDIIRLLQPSSSQWFDRPSEGMTLTEVCAASGYRAGPLCRETRQEWVPEAGLRSEACPYHISVALDASEKYRVNAGCYSPAESVIHPWFVLPPAMEYYYRMRNPSYLSLPPFLPGCADDMKVPSMEFIYPPHDARIFIPRSLGGEMMSVLPEIAHRRKNAVIYWHLDDTYIGMTRHIHQTELRTGEGEHVITAVDDKGLTVTRRFYCIGSL